MFFPGSFLEFHFGVFHELSSRLMEFRLHFGLFSLFFILCIRIRDICECVKLDATIQCNGVFSIKFCSNHNLTIPLKMLFVKYYCHQPFILIAQLESSEMYSKILFLYKKVLNKCIDYVVVP